MNILLLFLQTDFSSICKETDSKAWGLGFTVSNTQLQDLVPKPEAKKLIPKPSTLNPKPPRQTPKPERHKKDCLDSLLLDLLVLLKMIRVVQGLGFKV